MLTRPVADRIPSITALRLNITTLYNVEANGTSAVATFQLRQMMPIRLALLELCLQNQLSASFPLLVKPSGVALANSSLQPGQAGPPTSFGRFSSASDVAVLLSLAVDPLDGTLSGEFFAGTVKKFQTSLYLCFFCICLVPVSSNLFVSFAGVSRSQSIFALRLRNAEFPLDMYEWSESISFAFACMFLYITLFCLLFLSLNNGLVYQFILTTHSYTKNDGDTTGFCGILSTIQYFD